MNGRVVAGVCLDWLVHMLEGCWYWAWDGYGSIACCLSCGYRIMVERYPDLQRTSGCRVEGVEASVLTFSEGVVVIYELESSVTVSTVTRLGPRLGAHKAKLIYRFCTNECANIWDSNVIDHKQQSSNLADVKPMSTSFKTVSGIVLLNGVHTLDNAQVVRE